MLQVLSPHRHQLRQRSRLRLRSDGQREALYSSGEPADTWQSLFIHDFPKCSIPQGLPDPRTNTTHSSAFSLPFLDLLFRLGLPKKFTNPFATFDFSASCIPDSPRLVVSNQGTWSGWSEIREGGGIVSLASAVADLGLDLGKGGNMTLEVAVSSSVPTLPADQA